ncbi:PI31 proteasome regulator N-terminal-domain-containing protein [Talaromyces proteolyticus]|uniref:PI31 proteasome regulator N-terminal-domain-containing protein n=1 Tax=Talaromyces proteolyticus TaxID=1131652 RepID=A0AAD4Q5Z7_9EURO|nr:PI31 proteasome regulator N-terminal-domain-containing protein [Talaromyces proteolyticus]KAH8705161.1 PI31 proteasome regulator N-terminal-domain-containing protein [Talaromyces proteolyticus]
MAESGTDSTRILDVALQSLRGDGQTEATIQNPYELVALVGHASLVAAGFRLVGLGEDHTLESNTDATVLPKEWNAHNYTYAFRYAPSESSTQYILKVNRLGSNAVVMGLAGEDKATSFDIPVNDYISAITFPLQLGPGAIDKLKEGFVSQARLEDLISLFKLHVIQKFTPPRLPKEITDETEYRRTQPEEPPRHDPLRDDQAPAPAVPRPFDDPLAAAPQHPAPVGDFAPPGFEDEFEMNRPPRGIIPPFGGGTVPRSGQQDLYPQGLGPYDPLRGTFGPGQGGGGMHPTPDDPMFGGSGGQGGYDPRAPPGSRYDPVGPWDTPPSGRNQGPGGRGFGGSGGFGPGGFGGGDII